MGASMRHAYLIIAHDRPEELQRLIRALDYPDNAIYMHVDAKSTMDVRPLAHLTEHSPVTLIDRKAIAWGGGSIVDAELRLFEAAYKDGGFRYYHLLSGVDYPVKSQQYIHDYFEHHNGENFIQIEPELDRFRMKFDQYHFLQEKFVGKKRNLWKYIDFASCYAQRLVGVRRFKGHEMKRAIQWVSITDEAVAELVRRKDEITKRYRWTYCCDEIFLVSELIGTPLEKTITGTTNLRYIEWEWVSAQDSSPRVLTTADIRHLEPPDILFARKFNLPQSVELYQTIDDAIASNAEGLLNHKEVAA
ncbi:beta-1,6-N-acetylglucosaminyltransferase [Bifidobacterium choerinum]|uniref:Peptide O-xylosyltransferase n=2 Tax=Bifidobacterium choerinum TaxID=35760 RepID=A0A087ADX2_9BIFI|nr:beta-1,6-N-acetylglucosaminyltransferase [Bifidobacterium choerinum]KFI56972.1 putative glycosyltransferase [Bifidobacterium choerinum]